MSVALLIYHAYGEGGGDTSLFPKVSNIHSVIIPTRSRMGPSAPVVMVRWGREGGGGKEGGHFSLTMGDLSPSAVSSRVPD